jgi:hypothetical protein
MSQTSLTSNRSRLLLMPHEQLPATRRIASWSRDAGPGLLALAACLVPKCPLCWMAVGGLSTVLVQLRTWRAREILLGSALLILMLSVLKACNYRRWAWFTIGISILLSAGLWIFLPHLIIRSWLVLLVLLTTVGLRWQASRHLPSGDCQGCNHKSTLAVQDHSRLLNPTNHS